MKSERQIEYQQLENEIIERRWLTSLDVLLSAFLAEHTEFTDELSQCRFRFLVAILSANVRSGHVCLDLSHLNIHSLFFSQDHSIHEQLLVLLDNPTLDDWLMSLNNANVSNGSDNKPLVLWNNRLYFQRYWHDENSIVDYFSKQSEQLSFLENVALLEDNQTRDLLLELFPTKIISEIDLQKVAVAMALTRQVTIISGGPGTGKTTTVAKLLVALISLSLQQSSKSLRIIATAPTGKAAARLTESLGRAFSELSIANEVRQSLPKEAMTLHRLLGAQQETRQFVFHQNNPLHLDVLIIDEASMVDLALMANIIKALPANARLILLGDREQLSSVEAGAVFGDLCSFSEIGLSLQRAKELSQLTNETLLGSGEASLADNICLLQKSYRFDNDSGIGRLAAYVREGQVQESCQLLINAPENNLNDIALSALAIEVEYQQLINYCVDGYRHYLSYLIEARKNNSLDIKLAIEYFSQFRLLCALKAGPFGVDGLNQQILHHLIKAKLIDHHSYPQSQWYIGRPVMILRNSSQLGLYNGDIGITLPSLDDPNKQHVFFQIADGSIRGFSPYRLPEHETAFAMTVHKSQGSEFNHVCIVLPPENAPILNRSLLYTAITRAKQQVRLFANFSVLEKTIATQVERTSGIKEKLRQ